MSLKVYGIPNCGTCKKAFKWLQDQGIEYEFINTKEVPPPRDLIQQWITELGVKPLRNTSGQSYRALGEQKNTWTEAQWLEAFAQDAMLLKRPVLMKDGQAVMVGFKEATIQQQLNL
ncbi:arsenate reductase family protein [Pantanalinema sp. GBBB05]|uniref:arsenate reductase family protein n=1 Tax=Pantanalinema sp. GBBB05 TaxID=2604139 RepID=UPI001DE1B536|nr:Spx/MgsR family RNA polymerase-binding regulatory protein [Pantanalinema sp. GBBB05]